MNKIDKNSVLGYLMLGILLIGYIVYTNKQEKSYMAFKKAQQDSIALVQKKQQDSLAALAPIRSDSLQQVRYDSLRKVGEYGIFASADSGASTLTTVDNGLLHMEFTTRGGRPVFVGLNAFKSYTGKQVNLVDGKYNNLGLRFLTSDNKLINTSHLNFTLVENDTAADGSKVVKYRLYAGSNQQYIEFAYTLPRNKYMVDFNIHLVGLQGLVNPADNQMSLLWDAQANQQEDDRTVERNYTQVYYRMTNTDEDYFSLIKTSQKDVAQPLQWISFKQQFFNRTFIAQKGFAKVEINTSLGKDTTRYIGRSSMVLHLAYTPSADFSFPMQVYYGPNDYELLKAYHLGLEHIIPLGYGLESFAKYINRWLFLPLFILLGKFIGNWGIVIILMTIVIRLLISPLTYKSYVSQAKMKVLKPELDELKAKYKNDQQRFSMEQMKLFKTAGVSPLGGCVPMLLQIPIFFSLYFLFQSAIEVRHQAFLWVPDLSTYDSIAHLPFSIPLYGDHVSLLTLLMTATSLLMAVYNKNMTMSAGQDNPALKYMPYIMPIFFLGFFNRMAAALTLYYFISNLITLIIQWVIQNFIIDEKKIHAQIQENKKKGPQKSKWMERLEQVQKQQAQTKGR